MKKKFLKIITIIFSIIVMFSSINMITYAADSTTIPVESIENVVNGIKDAGVDSNTKGKAATITMTILTIVTYVGAILGTIMLIIFGIRWMTANPAAKSKLKEEIWNYILGAIFLIGAGPLATAVYDLMSKI